MKVLGDILMMIAIGLILYCIWFSIHYGLHDTRACGYWSCGI